MIPSASAFLSVFSIIREMSNHYYDAKINFTENTIETHGCIEL